jgi:hypothetical protein
MFVIMAHESRKHNTCELVFAQLYETLYQKEQIVGYYKTILSASMEIFCMFKWLHWERKKITTLGLL